jgi:serine/threonine-protein kinase/endoribonuclease IRE1
MYFCVLVLTFRNVLANRGKDGQLRMVVSDFGLARRLEQDQSSFAPTANNLAGSLGWRAPECIRGQVRLNEGFDRESTLSSSSSSGSLLDFDEKENDKRNHARLTKAVDLFALGCLYFWVLMSGQHPFGETYNRESNIVKGDVVNMGMLEILGEEGVEAQDLISHLLSLNPASRYVPKSRWKLTNQARDIGMLDASILLDPRQATLIPMRRFRSYVPSSSARPALMYRL